MVTGEMIRVLSPPIGVGCGDSSARNTVLIVERSQQVAVRERLVRFLIQRLPEASNGFIEFSTFQQSDPRFERTPGLSGSAATARRSVANPGPG